MGSTSYVPRLQRPEGIAWFFRNHRGALFASSALMEPMSRDFAKAMETFAKRERVPVVTFAKGQRKDDVMHEHLARFKKEQGVLFIGKAQEKATVIRTERRRNPKTGQTYPWLVRHGHCQPILLLLRRRGLWSLLPQVQFVFSLQCEALYQRS